MRFTHIKLASGSIRNKFAQRMHQAVEAFIIAVVVYMVIAYLVAFVADRLERTLSLMLAAD